MVDLKTLVRPCPLWMLLIMVGFIGVTALEHLEIIWFWRIGSYIPFISTFSYAFRAINGYAVCVEADFAGYNSHFCSNCKCLYRPYVVSLVLQTDDLESWETFKRAF